MVEVIVLDTKLEKKGGQLQQRSLEVNIFNGDAKDDDRIKVFDVAKVAKEQDHKYFVKKVSKFEVEDGVLWLNKGFCREKRGTLLIMYGEGPELRGEGMQELIPGVVWMPNN